MIARIDAPTRIQFILSVIGGSTAFKEIGTMANTPLTDSQIDHALQSLAGWTRDGDLLVKTYALPSYMAGLAFASAVGTVCEGMDHHPDMYIGYKKVRISFSTHDAGSKITQKDVDAASAIESLGYPKKA
jgi:4a-hydroxytetrahydrobiopterin dehydratase